MLLSILICSIVERADKLEKLLEEFTRQIGMNNDVEVLVETDNREMPTGEKRNRLLDRSKGKYIAFFDDDDWPDERYVELIIDACKKGDDCIGIKGIINFKTKQWSYFTHSIECAGWYTGLDGFYRTPNHLNPVKAEFAKRVRFNGGLYQGEDQDYSNRIIKYLKSETFIDHPIYHYWSRTKLA